jgi:hypothetical protein
MSVKYDGSFEFHAIPVLNTDNALMANMYCIELTKEAQGASLGIMDGTRANL